MVVICWVFSPSGVVLLYYYSLSGLVNPYYLIVCVSCFCFLMLHLALCPEYNTSFVCITVASISFFFSPYNSPSPAGKVPKVKLPQDGNADHFLALPASCWVKMLYVIDCVGLETGERIATFLGKGSIRVTEQTGTLYLWCVETAVSLQTEQYHCLPTLLSKDMSFPLQWNDTIPRRTAGIRLHPWGLEGSTWAVRCTKTWYMLWEAEMIRQSSVVLRDTTLEQTSGLLLWPWHPAGAEWVWLGLLAYNVHNVLRAWDRASSSEIFLSLPLYFHLYSSVRETFAKRQSNLRPESEVVVVS